MMRFYFTLNSIVICLLTVFCNLNSYAQNYGLGFASHEAHQDKRTTLDLTSEKDLCFSGNFDISFELSFVPHRNVYFGYILRIIENDKNNYDLVYNTAKDHFNVIVGDSLSGVNYNIPRTNLYNKWNKIRVRFDVEKQSLSVISNNKTYTQKNIAIKKNGCYKIVFGANKCERFETTDIPPMKIRNVVVYDKGSIEYNWPLNEVSGNYAFDIIKNKKSAVSNPQWQTALHSNWNSTAPLTVNGIASVAFNNKKEQIYIVAADTVYTYSVGKSSWSKNQTRVAMNLNQGNRSFYNELDNSLYNYFMGREAVAKYNFDNGSWSKNFPTGDVTGYWHSNKMFCKNDSSLYIFGGYGYLLYKNEVKKYTFNTNTWDSIKYKGDFFTPRYLAGLGATANGDTAYILGGYGSTSGEQILNPRNLYDMMRFTVKDQTFRKLFELKIKSEDFALANSLVIDGKHNVYYGLIFPRNKYNSTLQLIRGSLKDPSYQVLGSAIPYAFHDVHSFADLYYCKKSNKFIAVTLLRGDDNKTVVRMFTLLGPPYFGSDKLLANSNKNTWYIALAALCLLAGVAVLVYHQRKKAKQKALLTPSAYNSGESVSVDSDLQLNEMELAEHSETKSAATPQFKNAILLFGDLQVFDSEGNSITKLFTPLIKELFLLLLLHSVKLGRGVSSDKLNEMFWFDKSEKSARNNRSVAIVKLKSLLEKLEHCKLSKDSGYWMIEIDYHHFYVDYHSYLNIINNRKRIDDNQIQHLSSIVQRGSFLSTSEYEWLDIFKSEISNDIINTYLHFLQMPEHHNDPEFLIKIASYILNIDPVNEEAMILKCRSFVTLGKHSLAKSTFEVFTKAYKNMYGNSFDKDFHSVLEKGNVVI
ncbi:galactose oxidase [Mucilaginibacter limnophilus]|uniref:Galactose oxidase n=1 Tax=Mucilaginibacter limnophilus TaxID=1932778 RepID=A0A437MTK4_9SPHI|nr:galactose oxidase [Mucilaginibacter limnophilus]RVU00961.1 galactose oxidase [Mucilaginibacter limnophilus]